MKSVEVFVLCVMCMHTWPGMCLRLLLDMQGHGLSCDGVCLVVLCQSMLLCEVLSLPIVLFFLCVFMFWCLVMSSPVGAWSLISHHNRCVCESISYLIFLDKILSRVVIVCLSGVHCHIFSSFLFIWIE